MSSITAGAGALEGSAGEGARTPAPDGEPLIELMDVTKTYRSGELDVEVLHGVSLKIYPGEFLAIRLQQLDLGKNHEILNQPVQPPG